MLRIPSLLLSLIVLCSSAVQGKELAQPSSSTSARGTATAQPILQMTLQEAIQRALARNGAATMAQIEVTRAEALVRQVRASSFPTLTGNMTYTRLDNERTFGERVIAGANSLSGNVALNLPLLNTQHWVQWSQAKDNVALSRLNAVEVRRQIAAAVARAYLAILAQRRVIEVNERARDNANAHLAFARQRFSAGAGTRLELARAGQEAAADEAQVQVAYGGLARVREALGVLVGANGPIDAVAEEPALGQPPAMKPALDDIQLRRSDIHLQETRAAIVRKVVRDSWADFMPLLTALFQPFYQNPPTLVQPLTGWQVLLTLTVPLYDGGLRYGQQRERRALLASAQANLEQVVRQARADVRAAFAVLKQIDKALIAAHQAAQLAEEAFQLANRAYQAGATTNLELIDAVRRARDAETAAVMAEDAVRNARLDLLIASGHFP